MNAKQTAKYTLNLLNDASVDFLYTPRALSDLFTKKDFWCTLLILSAAYQLMLQYFPHFNRITFVRIYSVSMVTSCFLSTRTYHVVSIFFMKLPCEILYRSR